MHEYAYYLFNVAVGLPVTVLSIVRFRGVSITERSVHIKLLRVIGVSATFILWDAWAVSRGHWSFNGWYVTGARIAGMPPEELLFFISVPIAMLYVWLWIQKIVPTVVVGFGRWLQAAFVLVCTGIVLTQRAHDYTFTAALVALAVLMTTYRLRLYQSKQFWIYQLAGIVLFFIFNTILTALPIITYSTTATTGIRLGTIPVEDILFNYSLNTLVLGAYLRFKTWSVKQSV